MILRVLVFSWWIGPGLYREDAKTQTNRQVFGCGCAGFTEPASTVATPLRTLNMRPGVVALKEILPQGLLPLVVDLRIVSYGVVPLHLSDDLAFHSQD